MLDLQFIKAVTHMLLILEKNLVAAGNGICLAYLVHMQLLAYGIIRKIQMTMWLIGAGNILFWILTTTSYCLVMDQNYGHNLTFHQSCHHMLEGHQAGLKNKGKKGNDEKVKQSQSSAGSSKSVPKRNQHSLKCGRCGELGHNARTCYGKQLGDRMLAPGENQTNPTVQQPQAPPAPKKKGPAKKKAPSKKAGPSTATTTALTPSTTTEASPATKTGPIAASTTSVPPVATNTRPPSTCLNTVISKPFASNNVSSASSTVTKTDPKKTVSNSVQSNSVQSNSVPIVKPQIVGENILMVPKKCRNIGLKRKSDEMEPIGTQQSVTKK